MQPRPSESESLPNADPKAQPQHAASRFSRENGCILIMNIVTIIVIITITTIVIVNIVVIVTMLLVDSNLI